MDDIDRIHALRVQRLTKLQQIKEIERQLLLAQVELLEIEREGSELVLRQRTESPR